MPEKRKSFRQMQERDFVCKAGMSRSTNGSKEKLVIDFTVDITKACNWKR
jgi:hypothetical protein